MQYQTKDGDRLDQIVYKYYGTQDGTLEAVLVANQNLAGRGVVLSAGLIIDLPELDVKTAVDDSVNIWG